MIRTHSLIPLAMLSLILMGSCVTKKSVPTSAPELVYHRFEEVDSLMKAAPKPIAVFIHADWCRYCQNMKHTTFADPGVVRRLNEQFYFVSFNGEYKDNILFQGRMFRYQPSSQTHELAQALGTVEGTMTYPTFTLLNHDYEITFQHNAFLNAQEMRSILDSACD